MKGMKKRKAKYTEKPVGKIKIVVDFLPKPKDLVLKKGTTKATILANFFQKQQRFLEDLPGNKEDIPE